jgi:hypothetical protein
LSGVAAQIGETLWQILHPDARSSVPPDFVTRHLLVTPDTVGVWSRRGSVLAYKPSAKARAEKNHDLFRKIVDLAGGVHALSKPHPSIKERVRRTDELTRRASETSHDLALPESRLLARFFEATNLTASLQTLRDLNMQSNTHTIGEVQTKVEWLEVFIVGFYATELANIVMHHVRLPHWGSVLTILARFGIHLRNHLRLGTMEACHVQKAFLDPAVADYFIGRRPSLDMVQTSGGCYHNPP